MSDREGGSGQATPFGPFMLARRIAVGGSAEVFLARPKSGAMPAPQLVVKRLISGKTEDQFGILDHEADLHRAVDHPNVVKVFGAGLVGDEPYLAMEYVAGVDLYKLIRYAQLEERRISQGVAVYITRCLAAALSAVHTAKASNGTPLGIVHRDVTPSNVYLSVDGQVKLGDFGIARVSEQIRPPSGKPGLKGKFAYVAPEQIAGESFDHRADLFALTAILGELLIGERVFPGEGQLAVLLSIRDGKVIPLKSRVPELPDELVAVCERGLARDPGERYSDAIALSDALAPFERPKVERLREQLGHWVRQAADEKRRARQISDSVQRMRAVGLRSRSTKAPAESVPPGDGAPSAVEATKSAKEAAPAPKPMSPSEEEARQRPTEVEELSPRPPPTERVDTKAAASPNVELSATRQRPTEADALAPPGEREREDAGPTAPSRGAGRERIVVRCQDGRVLQDLTLPGLLELVATGELEGEDQVSFASGDFRRIGDVPELARHLLPSTTETTRQLFKLGAPDFRSLLSETTMMAVLAAVRQDRQTGAVFVERSDRTGSPQRKELYLRGGRLLHVASSDRSELLGEYLVRRGALSRAQLDVALASMTTFGGRLGDTVIGLGYADAMDVFRAIRDQGRDRVAALCGWKRGTVSFYKDTTPGHVEFPLDLDLASPMMAGAIVQSQGDPRSLLPGDDTPVEPGPRHYKAFDPVELGTAPRSLRLIPRLVAQRPSIGGILSDLISSVRERRIGEKEAAAALVAAKSLGWVRY